MTGEADWWPGWRCEKIYKISGKCLAGAGTGRYVGCGHWTLTASGQSEIKIFNNNLALSAFLSTGTVVRKKNLYKSSSVLCKSESYGKCI